MRVYTKKSEQEKRIKLRKNMTKAEVYLWHELKNNNLGFRFLRQYSIENYVVDFYCPKKRLAIEIDGATHISEEEHEYDKKRQEFIESFNIKFLRFDNIETYENMNDILEKIKEKLIRNPHC